MMSPRTVARRLGAMLLPLAVLTVALMAVAVLTGSWQARPVLSGSMEPTLSVGSVAVAQRVDAAEVSPGDILLFTRPDSTQDVIHRVEAVRPGPRGPVVTTRGDANDVADAWDLVLPRQDAYLVRGQIPLLGHVALWWQGIRSQQLLLLSGVLLLVATLAMAVRTVREHKTMPASSDGPTSDETASDLLPVP